MDTNKEKQFIPLDEAGRLQFGDSVYTDESGRKIVVRDAPKYNTRREGDQYLCDCLGFTHRGICKHVNAMKPQSVRKSIAAIRSKK